MGLLKTNLDSLDFAKLYKEQIENSTFKTKQSDDWDKRADSLNKKVHNSIYTKEFIQKIDLDGAKSLLDVGCGPGTISLALAKDLQEIYALDYSKAMLECVTQNSKEQNINNIKTIHKSWDDSWDDLPDVDIVVASRSMEVKDIKESLIKLNSKAKKRVYLTTKVGGTFIDQEILNQLQRDIIPRPDYIYLVNVLHSMGINAKVDFILSEYSKFQSDNADEFIQRISWSLGEVSEQEKEILKEYFNTRYKLKKQNDYMNWAFISWDVKQ